MTARQPSLMSTAGDYLLRETQAPSADYDTAPDTVVNIYGGVDDQEVEVVNTLKPGRIRIFKVDEGGQPAAMAPASDWTAAPASSIEACDNGAGDGNAHVGHRFSSANIPPADWTIIETRRPDRVTSRLPTTPSHLSRAQAREPDDQNEPTPPSTDKGTVVINKLVDGDLAPGACF